MSKNRTWFWSSTLTGSCSLSIYTTPRTGSWLKMVGSWPVGILRSLSFWAPFRPDFQEDIVSSQFTYRIVESGRFIRVLWASKGSFLLATPTKKHAIRKPCATTQTFAFCDPINAGSWITSGGKGQDFSYCVENFANLAPNDDSKSLCSKVVHFGPSQTCLSFVRLKV